jgi:hypothetical protein
MGPMHLELHYRVDPLLELDSLKDTVDALQGMSIS